MIVHLLTTPLLQYQSFPKYTPLINLDYSVVKGELLDAAECLVIESKLTNIHIYRVHVALSEKRSFEAITLLFLLQALHFHARDPSSKENSILVSLFDMFLSYIINQSTISLIFYVLKNSRIDMNIRRVKVLLLVHDFTNICQASILCNIQPIYFILVLFPHIVFRH